MKNTTRFLFLLVVVTAVIIAGCTQQQAPPAPQPAAQAPPATAAPPADSVRVAGSPLGGILVDSAGMTLYYFARDVPSGGTSMCSGQCAAAWPVFNADPVKVSAPLKASDFSSFTRADGKKQTAYRGWPLYYWQADTKSGDVKGENVQNVWYVLRPDETVLIAQQTALGTFLTDNMGRTLYYFAKDAPGTASCTGACLAKWPAFNAQTIVAPSVLKPSDFSTVARSDGVMQTAFMGRMLYYFADDAKPGDATGQGFNNAWYVANITGYAPPVPTPTPVPTTRPTIDYGSDSGGGGGGGGGY